MWELNLSFNYVTNFFDKINRILYYDFFFVIVDSKTKNESHHRSIMAMTRV